MVNGKIIAVVVAVVGVVLVALSAIMGWVVLPKVIDKKIEEEVRLINGTDTWDKWSDIDLPIHFKFYIFEVTNPDAVYKGETPIFRERGPLVYEEKRRKINLTVEGDGEFITYRQPIQYFYREDLSDLKEDEEVTSVIEGIIDKVGEGPIATMVGRYLSQQGENITKTVKAGDLTFNGFDVQAYTNNSVLDGLLPEEFEGGRFGLYKGNNNSDDGEYKINSGVFQSSQFGNIVSWNGLTRLGYWNFNGDSPCDMINGTDGSIYPPFVDEDRVLRVFVVDLCRSLYLTYNSRMEFMGIKGYRFTVPPQMLEDPRTNKDNRCFCRETDEDFDKKCPGGGAIDVSICRGGAPIWMSAPYFLDGDDQYKDDANLIPDRIKHQTVMDLEPNSGVLLNANKRLQVNIRLTRHENIPGFSLLRKEPDIIFPLVWVDETASMDEKSVEELKNLLIKPIKIINISKWSVLGVGIAATVIGIGLFFFVGRGAVQTV